MNGVLHSEQVISRSGIAVSPMRVNEDFHSLALRSAGVTFLSTTVVVRKRCFLKRTPKSLASRRLIGPECTPATKSIQIFNRTSKEKLWQNVFTTRADVAWVPHTDGKTFAFQTAHWLLPINVEECMHLTGNKGPDI